MVNDLEDRIANSNVAASTPFKSPFHTSCDFISSYQPTRFNVKHKPWVATVTLHLVWTIFSLPPFPSGDDLPTSLWSASPQPQPTLTGLRKAAKHILIHSSSALLWPGFLRCCWSSPGVQEGFLNQPVHKSEWKMLVQAGAVDRTIRLLSLMLCS